MRNVHTRARARFTAMAAAAAVAMTALVVSPVGRAEAATAGPAPVEQRAAAGVTADPIPTVQIDSGVVWAQIMAGDTVFAGGSFANARPAGAAPGVGLMPRSNILAYDINTGVATSFAPQINGAVKALALSPDKRTLYVGGSFTKVGDQARFNLAAFDVATGALLPFRPAIGGSFVNAIAVTGSTVYVGGLIGAATGVVRKNLAAVSTSGALLAWAPTTDLQVDAMTLTPNGDRLIVGGRFNVVNGVNQKSLAAFDLNSGATLPWAATAKIQNGNGKAGVWSLTADANAVYGSAWSNGRINGNLEGAFSADPSSGQLRWVADCHGDHYGIYSDGTTVYTTNHVHDCATLGGFPNKTPAPGNQRHASAYTAATKGTLGAMTDLTNYHSWEGNPAPALVNWFPEWTIGTASGMGQAGWTITGNGKFISVGGEFPYVNGKRHQGLVRFAVAPEGGAKQAPRLAGSAWQPVQSSLSHINEQIDEAGMASITVPSNWDRDDINLTYEVWAQGGSAPLTSVKRTSFFWRSDSIRIVVPGLPPGQSSTVYVVARDGDGNTAQSAPVTVTTPAGTRSAYAEEIVRDDPSLYWRLFGSVDLGNGNANWGGTYTHRWEMPSMVDAANKAGGYNTANWTSSAKPVAGPQEFSTEIWFKTPSTQGGKLVGFGDSPNGPSAQNDRNLYMLNDGRLVFGVFPGTQKIVVSGASYNDDRWHHAVASLDKTTGMNLYVDGKLVGWDPLVKSAEAFTGYWRIGGDSLAGWQGTWSNAFFNGSLDEFAVYPRALTAQEISDHYAIGTGQTPAPTARVTASGAGLTWTMDGTASAAASGRTITSYAWDFGDGTTGSGAKVEHTYAQAGSYTVRLTVTDDRGKTATASATATPTRSHAAPQATVRWTADGLAVQFDAGGTTFSDGAQARSLEWEFGDGTRSTETAPRHVYAVAGTYTATVRVTDSEGAVSAPASADVTVTGPPVNGMIAKDTFGRDSTVGWGAAEIGGTWSGSAGLSVAGGAGRISVNAGQTRTTLLGSASVTDSDVRFAVSFDKVANGGGMQAGYLLRKTAGGDYRAKIVVNSAGAVLVSVVKVVGTTETVLSSKTVPGLVYTAGTTLHVHASATSTAGATVLKANVWRAGAAEPVAWLVEAGDVQAELQGAGQIGVTSYQSASSTAGTVVVTIDDLEVR